MDPLSDKYPGLSPYTYTGNNPVRFIDPDGRAYGDPPWAAHLALGMERAGLSSEQASGCLQEAGKNALRYGSPLEDLYALFTGNDFDGNEYNRAEAAGWSLLSFVPGTKFTKMAKALKYSDEVADLIKVTGKMDGSLKEIVTVTKSGSFRDARKVADDVIGNLGDDAVEHIGRQGPLEGKTVGYKSADGSRGWRIDYDDTKGAHINWWNKNQKGAIPFDGGIEQAKRIVDNEVIK